MFEENGSTMGSKSHLSPQNFPGKERCGLQGIVDWASIQIFNEVVRQDRQLFERREF